MKVQTVRASLLLVVPAVATVAAFLGGCTLAPTAGETAARTGVARVGAALRLAPASNDHRRPAAPPSLPVLRADSPPDDFIRYAVLNHPAVAAAYYDWRVAVDDIAPARALPDPQFTFQADITNTLTSFMPGLMADLTGRGKRTTMAREATAAAEVARRAYVATVLRTAAEARKAWVELAYFEEIDRLYATTIHSAEAALDLTNTDYATGRGLATFDKQLQLENTLADHHAHHAMIADRGVAARARFKSALGLTPDDPDPPWPHPTLAASPIPSAGELWRRASATNADLAKMRAMVEMAVASVDVARQTGTPDVALGGMVDLKMNPLLFRPTATVSLPIWREKIAATIAAAEARRDAAAARVNAEQLNLAAELAQRLFMIREADRMLAYIDGTALPNFARTEASLEAGVQSGMTSPAMIADTRLMAIDLRHERLDWLRQRETAAVDLALLVADVAPAGAALSATSDTAP